jgi:hypothetical protein
MQLLSFVNAFGYPTETIARATFFADYGVDAVAVWILLRRRHGRPPQDYQRMRWVIWGCLIGLPAYVLSGIRSHRRRISGNTKRQLSLMAALPKPLLARRW